VSDVPAACQPLADAVAQAEQQQAALLQQADAQTGPAVWVTLEQVGSVRRDLASKRQALAACVTANTAAFTGELVRIETRPQPPAEIALLQMWDPAAPASATGQTQPQGGAYGFTAPVPDRKAVTVTSVVAGARAGAGFDFRSGELPAGAAQLRIELLYLPPVRVDAVTLTAWGKQVQVPPGPIATSAASPVLTGLIGSLTGVDVALAANQVTLTVHATVAAAEGGIVPLSTTPTPVAVVIPVVIHPDVNPLGDPAAPLQVSIPGTGVSVMDGGLFGGLASAFAPLFLGFLTDQISHLATTWLNAQVPSVVAAAFALDELPAGVQVCVRSLLVTPEGITADAVVGAVGTVLTEFSPTNLKPAPLP
jgi:hypothetical protein